MTIAETLLLDFDAEAIGTRRVLERVPADKADWKPHEKSRTLAQLALHVAHIPTFATPIFTLPEYNMATPRPQLAPFTTAEELVKIAAGAGAEMRTLLAGMSDDELKAEWTLRIGEHVITKGPRALMYRNLAFNHLIHHRGQLTVYLRLLDVPVPGVYGPSADEQHRA